LSYAYLILSQKNLLEDKSFELPLLPDVDPPWFPMDTKPGVSDIIALNPDSEEFQSVEEDFFKDVSKHEYSIFRVYRVQNLHQWGRYDT
jgi:hypothetical protein